MKLFLILIILVTLSLSAASASCEGPGSQDLSILSEDGKNPCYLKSSGIQIIQQGEDKFDITPLTVSVNDLPKAQLRTFFNVEYNQDQRPSKIRVMSFLCHQEIPLTADVFEGTLHSEDGSTPSQSLFISTGQAAEAVSVTAAEKYRSKIYDTFLNAYEERTNQFLGDVSPHAYIPNTLMGPDSPLKSIILNFFTKTNSSLNACSYDFLLVMDDLLIENVAAQHPFKGIELRKKAFSLNYQMRISY